MGNPSKIASFETRPASVHANEFGTARRATPAAQAAPAPAPAAPAAPVPLHDAVKGRLAAAGDVLWRVGQPVGLAALKGGSGSWDDVVHERTDHGAWDRGRPPLSAPTAAELSALDEVFDWLLWLTEEERPIVFARMCGVSYRKLSRRDPKRRSYRTLQRIYESGITRIVTNLHPA